MEGPWPEQERLPPALGQWEEELSGFLPVQVSPLPEWRAPPTQVSPLPARHLLQKKRRQPRSTQRQEQKPQVSPLALQPARRPRNPWKQVFPQLPIPLGDRTSTENLREDSKR